MYVVQFGGDQSGPALLHCVGAVQTAGGRTDCVQGLLGLPALLSGLSHSGKAATSCGDINSMRTCIHVLIE